MVVKTVGIRLEALIIWRKYSVKCEILWSLLLWRNRKTTNRPTHEFLLWARYFPKKEAEMRFFFEITYERAPTKLSALKQKRREENTTGNCVCVPWRWWDLKNAGKFKCHFICECNINLIKMSHFSRALWMNHDWKISKWYEYE